jgi:hypothetical protein
MKSTSAPTNIPITIGQRRRLRAGLAVGFGGASGIKGLSSDASFDSSLGIEAILGPVQV